MRTTELPPAHASAAAHFDTRFARLLVIVNGGVPLSLLAWDAYHHSLGANAVNFAIHTTGLLGLIFLLLSLTVTPVRLLTGLNPIISVRRALGLYAFFYLCIHFAIFFVFDRATSASSTVHEILVRRYLQLGTLGLCLLVPLAVTSTDAMVLRLGARRWKRLHRLVYVAAALGAVHYYLLVKADVRQPLVFAALLALLLGFRGVAYLQHRQEARLAVGASARKRRFWSGELVVTRVKDETPDVRTFRLGAVGGGPLPFAHQPGQYLNLALALDGRRVNRSYTIASPPTRAGHCEVTIKRGMAGGASGYLHDTLREGSLLKVSAPSGRFVFDGTESDAVSLIAGGVGITPLMAIVRHLTDRSWRGRITLVFSVRDRSDIIFSEELADLARRFPNLHVHVTLSGKVDPSWQGARGRISRELLAKTLPDVSRVPVYLCGPEPMMVEVRSLLAQLGVREEQIRTEAFVSLPATPDTPESAVDEVAQAGLPDGALPIVSFQRSMKSAELDAGKTILEAAEDADVPIGFECRSGICGQCKTKLVSGRVTMEVQDALSPRDRSKGLILACQARAVRDVVVDA